MHFKCEDQTDSQAITDKVLGNNLHNVKPNLESAHISRFWCMTPICRTCKRNCAWALYWNKSLTVENCWLTLSLMVPVSWCKVFVSFTTSISNKMSINQPKLKSQLYQCAIINDMATGHLPADMDQFCCWKLSPHWEVCVNSRTSQVR